MKNTTAKKVVKKTHIIGRDFGCSICMQVAWSPEDRHTNSEYICCIYIYTDYIEYMHKSKYIYTIIYIFNYI